MKRVRLKSDDGYEYRTIFDIGDVVESPYGQGTVDCSDVRACRVTHQDGERRWFPHKALKPVSTPAPTKVQVTALNVTLLLAGAVSLGFLVRGCWT